LNKTLIVAKPHGFCAGVERALAIADAVLKSGAAPIYCLREIVHNRQVIDDLAARGVIFVTDISEIPDGSTVIFSAHGVSPQVRNKARRKNLDAIDATCPFVAKVHGEVRRFAEQGYSIILVGHRSHDEIIGVAGEAPEHVIVVENAEEAGRVQVPDPARVAVMTQTTLSLQETAAAMEVLKRRFPDLKTPRDGDICYATRNRQEAVMIVARQTELVIVLGAENSSNSNRLVEVARAEGCRACLASSTKKLHDLCLDGLRKIGLTAGASTPESCVLEAVACLGSRGFSKVEYLEAIKEEMHFPLPARFRRA